VVEALIIILSQIANFRGVATGGGISVYIPPPNQSTVKKNLCGCFVSLTHLYPPKSNSWLRLWQIYLSSGKEVGMSLFHEFIKSGAREPWGQGGQMTPQKFTWGSNMVFWPPDFCGKIIIILYSESRSRTVFFIIIYNWFVDSLKCVPHDFDPPVKNSSRAHA